MNSATLLHRQINESWQHNGEVSSQAFIPTKKDEGRLSTYNGDMITPDKSWEHFNFVLRFKSIGVMAFSVGECQNLELPVCPDPAPFPEHTVVDFNGLSRKVRERKADGLKQVANSRGWMFQP